MNPFTYNVVLINILTNSVSSSIMAGKPPSDDEDPSAAPSGGSAIDEDAVPVSAIEPARCGLIGLGEGDDGRKGKKTISTFWAEFWVAQSLFGMRLIQMPPSGLT